MKAIFHCNRMNGRKLSVENQTIVSKFIHSSLLNSSIPVYPSRNVISLVICIVVSQTILSSEFTMSKPGQYINKIYIILSLHFCEVQIRLKKRLEMICLTILYFLEFRSLTLVENLPVTNYMSARIATPLVRQKTKLILLQKTRSTTSGKIFEGGFYQEKYLFPKTPSIIDFSEKPF